ncbi:MAG TPA: pilin [Luteibacter sp.]|jgi:type IV pilus assembly protein PilA|nr:pilin [Luteibacter sp.]
MKPVQQGFTLIELMIVVAIIAILAAIAIPAYQDYVIRAQVSEGYTLTGEAKVALEEYYASTGRFPSTADSAGLPNQTTIKGRYVSQVDASSRLGMILVLFNGDDANSKIKGLGIGLSAVTTGGSIQWTCTNPNINSVPNRYLPTSCRR